MSSYAGRQSLRRLQRSIQLEGILAGTTCAPISLRDFELYLAYRELSLENLQFVVWYLDYQSRFIKLPLEQQQLSPDPAVIVPGFQSGASPGVEPSPTPDQNKSSWGTWLFRRYIITSTVGKLESGEASTSPFPAVSPTPNPPMNSAYSPSIFDTKIPDKGSGLLGGPQPQLRSPPSRDTDKPINSVSPSKQPFRDETLRVVATFLRPGGTAQKLLALDDHVREEVFRNLALTTHPNAFQRAYGEVYDQLDRSARHFIALQTTNINLPKQILWYSLSVTMIILSILLAGLTIIMVPDHHPRYHPMQRTARLVATPFAYVGSGLSYAAWRGLCSHVYARGGAQLRAWELEDPREVGVKMRRTKEGKERKRRKKCRKYATDNVAGTEEDDGKGRTANYDGNHSAFVQELDCSSQKADPSSSTTSPNYSSNTTREATVIAASAFTRSPSSFGHHGELLTDVDGGDIITNDSWPSRSKSVIIDTSNGSATLAEGQSTPPPSGDEPTHEIVFTKPKRVSMADLRFLRPPVFGPERIVADERIRKYHEHILTNIIWAGVLYTSIFTAVILSLPGPSRSIK
ncbi:hypothetical protein FRB96_007665 [Tulasnella sp. 330]|nr:hypothetical protein FRB96_007665 [Tulasnella sp. 330]